MALPREQQQQQAKLLLSVLTVIASIFGFYLVAVFNLMPGITSAKAVAVGAFAVLVAAAVASRYQRFYRPAAFTLVATILVGGFVASLTNGGLEGYVTPILLTAPVAAAVFLNKKYVAGVVVALVAIFLVQVILENKGFVTPTPYPEGVTRLAAMFMLSLTAAVCAAAVGFFVQQSDRMIALLTASQEDLKKSQR